MCNGIEELLGKWDYSRVGANLGIRSISERNGGRPVDLTGKNGNYIQFRSPLHKNNWHVGLVETICICCIPNMWLKMSTTLIQLEAPPH
jgi:hypothetical protein